MRGLLRMMLVVAGGLATVTQVFNDSDDAYWSLWLYSAVGWVAAIAAIVALNSSRLEPVAFWVAAVLTMSLPFFLWFGMWLFEGHIYIDSGCVLFLLVPGGSIAAGIAGFVAIVCRLFGLVD